MGKGPGTAGGSALSVSWMSGQGAGCGTQWGWDAGAAAATWGLGPGNSARPGEG